MVIVTFVDGHKAEWASMLVVVLYAAVKEYQGKEKQDQMGSHSYPCLGFSA